MRIARSIGRGERHGIYLGDLRLQGFVKPFAKKCQRIITRCRFIERSQYIVLADIGNMCGWCGHAGRNEDYLSFGAPRYLAITYTSSMNISSTNTHASTGPTLWFTVS